MQGSGEQGKRVVGPLKASENPSAISPFFDPSSTRLRDEMVKQGTPPSNAKLGGRSHH
jgi:hypothetical protein